MNPYTSIFSGLGDPCPSGSTQAVDPFGSGLSICMPEGQGAGPAPLPSGCPSGQIGFPSLGIPCTAIPGQPQSSPPAAPPQCADGQTGWPLFGIPCLAVPTAPQSAPAPTTPNQCPPGQIGWPAQGIPCMSIPVTPTGPITPPPGPRPVSPIIPPPPPATPKPAPVVQASATPKWVVPVAIGVGAVALLAMFSKPRRARPNRRRHR
jgi:hypothetical protein